MNPVDLVVTNFNRNYTGVSATTAAVLGVHQSQFRSALVGHALPTLGSPNSHWQGLALARLGPASKPFQIWHVRRNSEMQMALFLRDVLRLPIKIVFTSAAQRLHSRWPQSLIRRMDAVIATTELAAGFVPNVWSIIPHGIDTKQFSPAENRQDAWTKTGYPGGYGLVTIGRVRPEKGTDRFVQAMIAALPKLPGATALVIGATKKAHIGFRDQLLQQIEEADLSERIIFTGELAASNVAGILKGSAALVALPRYEGYGVTPLEAMSSGVPIVASDAGHYRSFVGNSLAGTIVPSGDPAQAADAILALLADTETLTLASKAARARAIDHFSIEQEANEIAKVYEGLWAAT